MIHRVLSFTAALLLLSASFLSGRSKSKDAVLDLRLVSYNVGALDKYTPSTRMVASMLSELKPDFVGMQELDSCNLRHDTYQARDVAKSMKGRQNWHYTRAMPFRRGAYGNAVVTRHKILARYDVALPKGDRPAGAKKGRSEPRSVCIVETADAVFATTHLCYLSPETRLRQYAVLMDFFRANKFDKPVILCGDFNAHPDDPVMQKAAEDWTRLSPLEFTISSRKPHHTIDYILVLNNGWTADVKEARIPLDFKKGDVTMASDHRPVFVHAVFTRSR